MNNAKKRLILAITQAEQGGAQTFLLHFAIWLKQANFDVIVLTGSYGWLLDQCQKAGIATRCVPSVHRAISPFWDLKAVLDLAKTFQELKPDAVHLNSTKMGVVGALAAKLTHVPRVVYRIGGWVFLEPLPAWKKTAYRMTERLSAPWKDVIVCLHPEDAKLAKILDINPRETVSVIPNGLDVPAFLQTLLPKNQARASLSLQNNAFVFGTIANFYATKNLPHYLEACAIVAKNEPRARFILIGDGMERKKIEDACQRLNLTDRVFLPGAIADASQRLLAFDAFVLPSVKEGMSWSLLEAMAAGLPCIATNVGANPWMLEQAGWIVPSDDTQALASAMLDAFRYPKRAAQNGQQAQQEVIKRFPIAQTLEGNARALGLFPRSA